MAYKFDPMTVLAAMGAENITAVGYLLDIQAATILARYGDSAITISRSDLLKTAEEFEVQRTATPDGTWTIRLVRKDDGRQAKLFEAGGVTMDLEAEKRKHSLPPTIAAPYGSARNRLGEIETPSGEILPEDHDAYTRFRGGGE